MSSSSPAILPHSRGGIKPNRVLIPVPPEYTYGVIGIARNVSEPFDPSTVEAGTRIGWLTLVSDPEKRTYRIHGNPCRCSWGMPPLNRVTGNYEFVWPCLDTYDVWYADVICVCGWVIPHFLISGNPKRQGLHCGCKLGRIPVSGYRIDGDSDVAA